RSGRGRRARDLDRALVGRRRADVDERDLPGNEDTWSERVLRQDEAVAVLRVRELATVDAAWGEADRGEEQLQPRRLRFAHGLRRERKRRLRRRLRGFRRERAEDLPERRHARARSLNRRFERAEDPLARRALRA